MCAKDECLTISQAAEYCGVTRGTIHRWISERQLSLYRHGREAFIPRAQVEILNEVRSLDDVIREAAKRAGLPVHSRVQVRMNVVLMARHGKDVLELYDAEGTRAWGIRVTAEEL